eukprot:1684348-Rhodomonas_salina.1
MSDLCHHHVRGKQRLVGFMDPAENWILTRIIEEQTLNLETKKKQTIKILTSNLLKFMQGSEILEKEFGKKEIYKLQKLKMTYKDLM